MRKKTLKCAYGDRHEANLALNHPMAIAMKLLWRSGDPWRSPRS
jgi:hypothetical protein